MTDARQTTLRQRFFALAIAGIGATAALALSFVMAVYEAANPETVPVIAAGEPIDTGRWIVTVHGARAGNTLPTGIATREPKTFITVEFDLNNQSAATSNVFPKFLSIDPPIPDSGNPTVYLARDGSIGSGLNPDMPERMIAAWEWPSDLDPPRELRFLVGGQLYKRRDNLYGASGWFDRDPVAAVEIVVSREVGEAVR
ncbi:hypothetical protein ABFT80_20350 [Mesorhizobium sp. SB112]|uniref:hypothetical protein n=1 Tax=Mesorhizobium sp. SB112 TaxID=3151853 RepID=UPI003265B0F7